MQAIATIGLDIAKSVFQVHGIDAAGNVNHSPPAQAPLRLAVLSKVAVARAKPKKSTGQKSTRGNNRADAGPSSYAQQRPAWPTSLAEGTLGPH